jgi:hypothetical protein
MGSQIMTMRAFQQGLTRRQAITGLVAAGAAVSAAKPLRSETSWGRVFIFNTAPEPLSLELNRQKLPEIIGTARDDYYIPDVIAIDRSATPDALVRGEFAQRNRVAVNYKGHSAVYEIEIDPARYRFDQDIQLYVHRDGVVVLQNGQAMPGSVRQLS